MSDDEAGVSDWEEQDLLTVDLAAERLAAEIAALRRQIDGSGGGIDLTDARIRLEALLAAQQRLGFKSS